MSFLNPLALWLLLVVPPFGAACVWFAFKRRREIARFYGEERLISRFSQVMEPRRYIFKAVCVALTLAFLLLALARPALQDTTVGIPEGTVDVVAVVDVSRSMAAQDYLDELEDEPGYEGGTRLDMARYILVNDIIASLGYNRLGVVSYAGTAFPRPFLSDDLIALRWVMERALTINSAPGEGSDMATALALALTIFEMDSDDNHRKVIVLFSDGGMTGDPALMRQVTNELRSRGIELLVAGLGKMTPQPIPISQLSESDQNRCRYTGQTYYTDGGQIVRSALD